MTEAVRRPERVISRRLGLLRGVRSDPLIAVLSATNNAEVRLVFSETTSLDA